MPDWFLDARSADVVQTFSEGTGSPFNDPLTFAYIHTMEGIMRADRGDWIIRGIEGEMYPCKAHIFAATYQDASDPLSPEGEALRQIDEWAKAYPLDVFPEPDLKRAHEVLEAAGLSLGQISAQAMRHVLTGVQKIAAAAMAG
jgi:hypothetical protein